MSKRRTPSLIHRGYLYAQKRVVTTFVETSPSDRRMTLAEAWRAGYLQARRDARK